ncbi:MAG: hypothetical protein ACPGRC_05325 [Salibacteraceae bacterium]
MKLYLVLFVVAALAVAAASFFVNEGKRRLQKRYSGWSDPWVTPKKNAD